MRVAIIGMGVVGKAQARWLDGHDLITWDKAWEAPYPLKQVATCDFAIVTVGTPSLPDGRCDTSAVFGAVAALPSTLPVMIRSTVPPGTTATLAEGRSAATAFVPEFLYEAKYGNDEGRWHESAEVPWLLLGGDAAAQRFFRPFIGQVFPGKIYPCGAVVAELAKYTANLYWANRVTFVSEMAAITREYGVDWEEVREAWLMDERVSPIHTTMIGHPAGFGGKCWPKDLAALIADADSIGYKAAYLESIRDANARFRP